MSMHSVDSLSFHKLGPMTLASRPSFSPLVSAVFSGLGILSAVAFSSLFGALFRSMYLRFSFLQDIPRPCFSR